MSEPTRTARQPSRGVLHGLVVETPAPLPWAGPGRGGEADLLLELLPSASPAAPPVTLSTQIPGPRGEPWLSTGRLPGGGLFLRFAGSADFKVDSAGRRVLCRPIGELSAEEAVDLFSDGVVPFLLDHRGDTVLHAGAAVLPWGAAAILGTAGAGKSTLAAALGREGHRLLGDDVLVLRRRGGTFEASPGLRRVDLSVDSLRLLGLDAVAARYEGEGKVRVVESDLAFRFADAPVPLRTLFLLDPSSPARGDSPEVDAPLRPQEAVAVLADHLFRADRQDGARYESELERLCALAEAVPLRRVRGHRGAGRLPALVAALLGAGPPEADGPPLA